MPTVKVIEIDTHRIEKEIPNLSDSRAQKVSDGININLNHDKFIVVIDEDKKNHGTSN